MSALTKEAIRHEHEYKKGTLKHSSNKKSIKRKKKNRIVIDSFKNIFIVSTVFLFGLSTIYNYAVITDKKMEINMLDKEIVNLNNEVNSYNVTLESIKNTNKIEEMAKNYLGMNYPSRKQTVFIDFPKSDAAETNVVVAKDKGEQMLGLLDRITNFIQ